MRFTLRAKLFALMTLVVALTTATATWVFSLGQQQARRVAVQEEVARVAQNIAALRLDGHDWADYRSYIGQLLEFNRDIVYIAVYDDRNTLRAHALNHKLVQLPGVGLPNARAEAEIVRRLDHGEVAPESRPDLRTHVVEIQVGDRIHGSVHVGFSLIEINRDLARGIRRHVAIGLSFVLFSGILSFILSRRLTGPLERLSAAMQALADGDLAQRVAVESRDEIGQLAHTFNAMASDVRERQIIDRLGRTLGTTFAVDRLATRVRDELCKAIGAADTQLYLRRSPSPNRYALFGPSRTTAESLTIEADDRRRLLGFADGLCAATMPHGVLQTLTELQLAPADLVMPLQVKGELLGLLVLQPPGEASFDEKQKRLANTLAAQAALALENALLYEELAEQGRMRAELDVARAVQRRLLPREPPRFAAIEIDGICRPAHEVGGDYYDFIHLDHQRLGIVIADVSGKGASAALYMAEIKGMVMSLAPHCSSPVALLTEVNRTLYPTLDRHVFASVLYVVLDARSGRLDFARAGHPPLVHVGRNGNLSLPSASGIAVGIDPGPLFDSTLALGSLQLAEGDSVILLTDGITEAMSPSREPFGVERLKLVIADGSGDDPTKLRQRILAAVDHFAGDSPQFDDLTLIALRWAATGLATERIREPVRTTPESTPALPSSS